ncbi:hypothetical protein M407DRAFT_245276 [Tulasnella calospora MUT 4182]|uniref:Secreted protein n=1 Tax=Tulasnella calospora MUT 4182 TaxID=1051891 RepID=A0A0C3KL22_9AGAM|nr:hypothetical protein M407DRAFT_245276 [Tulasnella calospora MUT 4182]
MAVGSPGPIGRSPAALMLVLFLLLDEAEWATEPDWEVEAETARPRPLPFFECSDTVLVLALAVELGVTAPLVPAVEEVAAARDAADVLALGLGL